MPAEAVWGLSCDPWDFAAVELLCAMKRRSIDKGLIVASWTPEHFEPLLARLTSAERQQCEDSWPAPVTWLVPNVGYFPPWVTGDRASCYQGYGSTALVALSKAIDGPLLVPA